MSEAAPLKDRIVRVMRDKDAPVRVADIVKVLKTEGDMVVNAQAVNSVLYHSSGEFENLPDADNKPRWALKAVPVRITSIGALTLDSALDDAQLLALFSALAAVVPDPRRMRYPADAPRFGAISAAAAAAGFTVDE